MKASGEVTIDVPPCRQGNTTGRLVPLPSQNVYAVGRAPLLVRVINFQTRRASRSER